MTSTKRKGVTSIGRRKLDARKLVAATWTRDNWTRATIGRWTHAACFEIISQYLK
jgi:hypothetical protein